MNPREFLKQWREGGRDEMLALPKPESINAENRTIDIVWFTGADVPRYDWWTDSKYTLRFNLDGADLTYLNNNAPVCDNHMMYSVEDQLGRTARAWRENNNFLATLQFSKRQKCADLWGDIQDGIVSKFSMGVELMEVEDTRNDRGQLTMRTAVKWRPFELSVAPIPADWGTATLSGAPALIEPSDTESMAAYLSRARQIEILRIS